jgi:hypothetical protein
VRRTRALTIAEVVLAIGLTAGVLILTAVVMASGLRWLDQTRQTTVAQAAARDLLERVKEEGVSGLPADATYDGRVPTARTGTFPPPPYPGFSSDQTYHLLVSLSTVKPGLRSIQVDVLWGHNHKVRFETFLH